MDCEDQPRRSQRQLGHLGAVDRYPYPHGVQSNVALNPLRPDPYPEHDPKPVINDGTLAAIHEVYP